MVVRALRITDRLSNAVLRILAWTAIALVQQAADLRAGITGILGMIVAVVGGVFGFATSTVRRTSRTARQTYRATSQRSEEIRVQRAQEAQRKPSVVREDPLITQNRALSAFTVLLLLTLLAVVVIQTTDNNTDPVIPAGSWPEAQGTEPPTAIFPTAVPTETPIPDPLRVGGALVYSLHENGQDDLWALSVGESGPLRLTNHPADDRDPSWSPDGNRVAFASRRDGNWELYVLEIANGALTRLTYTPGFEGAPSWSPDGAFIAYEGYTAESQDLDVYIASTDPNQVATQGAVRLTYRLGPDIEPAWAPGEGRKIAYTTWTGTSKDIMILDLDNPAEAQAVNLTNTPEIDENHAAWSPDGTLISYSATINGVKGIYIKPVQQPDAQPTLIARGDMPSWAPNGASVVYTLNLGSQTQILAGAIGGFGSATDAINLPAIAADPHWTALPLPRTLIDSGGVPATAAQTEPLYQVRDRQKENSLYGLAPLSLDAPDAYYLSDRVNEAFEALRGAVLRKAGHDFLGTLDSAYWPLDRPPEPGEPRENWHYTGRAIGIQRDLIYAGDPAPLQVVREEVEVNTFWRVYVRVADGAQDGSLGEPLRDMPWDFAARTSGDVTDYERGGRVRANIPTGYYIDFTQLAADYGWQRLPALRTWQQNFGAIQFWEFVKQDGLSWTSAMLELYSPADLDAFLSGEAEIPAPPPLPTESPTPDIVRSPTPIPPDQR